MQQRERGSIEARLATVRLGLFSFAAVVIAALLGMAGLLYNAISAANDEDGLNAGYTFSEYMGDVGPVLIPSILIIFIAAVAINFGYTFYLRNQAEK